jgi:hypothetical protein
MDRDTTPGQNHGQAPGKSGGQRKPLYVFRLTPAEWRQLLADENFLRDPDNSFSPRRLMGVPVEIVPDHRLIEAR